MRGIRYWLPIAAGFACLIVAVLAAGLVTWLLLLLGFGLMFEGVTALWARSGDATEHRQ
jgi:predicted phage tail protein